MARTSVQTDDFADNDLTIGSVAWTQLNSGNAVMGNSGGVVFNNHSAQAAIRADGTYSADQYSKLALVTGTTASLFNGIGVIARSSTDTDGARDFYLFRILFGPGSSPFNYELAKVANGTYTNLKTGTAAFAVGNTIEIEVDGSSTTAIRGYINGTLIDSATDSSSPFTTGKPGIEIYGGIPTGDNWEGGNVTAGGLAATITTPTSSATYDNGTTSTITIGGTTTAATSVTWANDRGGSGSATNTGTSYSTWTISGITLSLGANVITVTAGDGSTTTTDTITVTYSAAQTFPTTSVLDVFTGTDGVDLPVYSANWTTLNSNAGYHELEMQGNAATSTTGAGADAADAWVTTYGPDSEVYATISTLPTAGGSGYVQLLARLQGVGGDNTFDGYGLEYQTQSGTDRLRLGVITNSGFTYLGSGDISQDLAAGDSIGLSIVGSTLQAWYKPAAGSWSTLGSPVTDTTYATSGKIGLYTNSTVVRIDSFGGGSYTAAGANWGRLLGGELNRLVTIFGR